MIERISVLFAHVIYIFKDVIDHVIFPWSIRTTSACRNFAKHTDERKTSLLFSPLVDV